MSIRQAREVLRIEAEGILSLIDRVGQSFAEAKELFCLACFNGDYPEAPIEGISKHCLE